MLKADLHCHTLFSRCGLFTYMDILTHARDVGVELLAITDHGTAVGGEIPGTFFERMGQPVPEVQLLKGIECNVVDDTGTIDLPMHQLKWMDLVLLGLHKNLPVNESVTKNTDLLILALDRNPMVDMITHPNDPKFPVDFRAVAEYAKEKGIALELNNSKIMYERTTVEYTREMLGIFADTEALLSVNSDTHALHELGRDVEVRPILEEVKYPAHLIVNRDVSTALAFVESRRSRKR